MATVAEGAAVQAETDESVAPIIAVSNLTKYYGSVVAVSRLSFTVHRGEVFGFLGPNGAGKTTTIRCMLDLIRPTHGTIKVCGFDAQGDSIAIRQRVGYVPGDVRLPGHLTGWQLLDRYSRLAGQEPVLLDELVERFDVTLDRPIKGSSKGMRQKIALTQAFMCDPEVVICDEPTAGLDPLTQQAFNEYVLEAARRGTTIFMSSHVISEVEKICERVGVIRDGHLAAVETVERLRQRAGQQVTVRFAEPIEPADLESTPGVSQAVQDRDGAWHLTVAGDINPLIRLLTQHRVERLLAEEAPLEEVFLRFYTPDHTSEGGQT